MAKFKKVVSAAGTYQTPDGLATVTPARLAHWRDTIKGMVAAGYKPPVAWGHVSKAVPHTPDDAEFWKARYNAGSITDAEIDRQGRLWFHCDAPGVTVVEGKLVSETALPDGRTVKTAIEEVSVGAADWTDGNGKRWKDAPIHLALTPLPVFVPEGGQPGFEPADLPGAQRFGTRSLLYRFATEGAQYEGEDKKPPKKEKGEGKKEDRDGETVQNESPGGRTVKDAVEDLAEYGIHLPDDTTDENFLDYLCVALHALKGGKEEPEAEPGAEDAVTQEPGATFMGTRTQDPVVIALLARVEADDRVKRLGRIDALIKRGLPGHAAKKLRAAASAVRFAVSPAGQPVAQAVDGQLDMLEETLPPEGVLAQLVNPGAGAEEAEPPESAQHPVNRHRAVAEEQARNSHLPGKRATLRPAGAGTPPPGARQGR